MKNLITCLIVCGLSGAAIADTWTVDDDGKADFDNIQAAVDAASSGDVIVVMPGTYVDQDGGGKVAWTVVGLEDFDAGISEWSLVIRSSDPNDPAVVASTIIDGEGTSRGFYSPILLGTSNSGNLIIEGFTIRDCSTINGQIDEFDGDYRDGGGIYCSNTTLTVRNCEFTNNSAPSFIHPLWGDLYTANGGAIKFEGYDNNKINEFVLTLENCNFANNSASVSGGAVQCSSYGRSESFSNNISDCTFTNNTIVVPLSDTSSFYAYGAGMVADAATLTNCVFDGNTITPDDVNAWEDEEPWKLSINIQGSGFNGWGLLSMQNCVFRNNSVVFPNVDAVSWLPQVSGGGAFVHAHHTAVIADCLFENNTSILGGGLFLDIDTWDAEGSLDFAPLVNCTFNNNVGLTGGGLYYFPATANEFQEGKIHTMENCIFNGNASVLLNVPGSYFGNSSFKTSCGAAFISYGYYTSEVPFQSVISDCDFIDNESAGNAGALLIENNYCAPSRGPFILERCDFINNTAVNSGALFATGVSSDQFECLWSYSFSLDNCLFQGNTALEYGGAIDGRINEVEWSINNSVFKQNSAIFGGAITFDDLMDQASISQSQFEENTANFGGSIYIDDCLHGVDVDGCIFDGGYASFGGAIYNRASVLDITNSILSRNTAYEGGGLFQLESLSAIDGTSWVDNYVANGGSAINNLVSFSTINNSSFCSANEEGHITGPWDGENNTFAEECDDCDGNGEPDFIEMMLDPSLDCNMNSIMDSCEIADGSSDDCNNNSIPDSCDFANGTSDDCNSNGIPDECDADCNNNGTPDDCDPEECPCLGDCNGDGVVDVLDTLLVIAYWGLDTGTVADINNDGIVNVADLLIVIAAWGPCE